jgi:hypothetical protein
MAVRREITRPNDPVLSAMHDPRAGAAGRFFGLATLPPRVDLRPLRHQPWRFGISINPDFVLKAKIQDIKVGPSLWL